MSFLTKQELGELMPAGAPSQGIPLSTQDVSNDEGIHGQSNENQSVAEALLPNIRNMVGSTHAMNRRRFFGSAGCIMSAFVTIRDPRGAMADVKRVEPATPLLAEEDDLSWVSDLAEIPVPVKIA